MGNKRISIEEKIGKITEGYKIKFSKYNNKDWESIIHLWIESNEWTSWSNREWKSVYRLIDNFYKRIIEVEEENKNKSPYNWDDSVKE